MKHDICLAGVAYGLRPAEPDDAGFIIELRRDSEHAKYMHPISSKLQDQHEYLERYYKKPDDYYFIVERLSDRKPQGTVAIYNIDKHKMVGEFGRWILLKHSMAAVESVLLLYRAAFDVFNLKTVYTRTVTRNEQVVSFHQSCGAVTKSVLSKHFSINGEAYDATEQQITRDLWEHVSLELAKKAEKIGQLVQRCR